MLPFETLPDMLLGLGIRPKYWGPGTQQQVICPKCRGGKTGEISLQVHIDDDGQGATWHCWRGSCDWKDGARLVRKNSSSVREFSKPERVIRPPPPVDLAATRYQPQWFHDFWAERNIGARTVDAFGCYAIERRWFPDPLGHSQAIVFPYRVNGEVVNHKYRPHPVKSPMMQDKKALPSLFNIDSIDTATQDEIYWVEGETDCLALFESGFPNVVTLPNGSGKEATFKPGDKRFDPLNTHSAKLSKIKRHVLAGDMDGPGLALREEIARRLGRNKCCLVDWPKGCKDAGDVLRLYGPDTVATAIAAKRPYPIEGIQRVTADALLALRSRPAPQVMSTGTAATNAILSLPAEGRLIVVTGYPNSGKTAWVRYVMVHTAIQHDRKWGVFSPEMMPWEQFAADCAETLAGKPFWPSSERPSMSQDEIAEAGEWLESRVTMLVCDSEDEAPSLDWLLERASACVLQFGMTDFLVDPWNEMDHSRERGVTETDFIGRSLQRIKAWIQRHGCNVWIIAHPAKPQGFKPGEVKPAPGPYDIAASAHWANKPDLGITIHSPVAGTAQLHLWKARFRRFGTRGTMAEMKYDPLCGRYSDPVLVVDLPSDGMSGLAYKDD